MSAFMVVVRLNGQHFPRTDKVKKYPGVKLAQLMLKMRNE